LHTWLIVGAAATATSLIALVQENADRIGRVETCPVAHPLWLPIFRPASKCLAVPRHAATGRLLVRISSSRHPPLRSHGSAAPPAFFSISRRRRGLGFFRGDGHVRSRFPCLVGPAGGRRTALKSQRSLLPRNGSRRSAKRQAACSGAWVPTRRWQQRRSERCAGHSNPHSKRLVRRNDYLLLCLVQLTLR
jgi:hypothetical protein